ncbi:MAG: flagellar hook-length control protein FliK, partial [Peptococcaceae bacterium]|nr:flagellar hook-length control protein FliK [Peptococcaceae bacterium]
PSYCHLALQLETPNLGQIGLDLLFYDNDLTLSLIYDEPEVLKPMLEITEEEVKENFSQLGITLKTISLKKKTDHPLFEAFINGQQLGGVDFKG